MHSFQDSKRRQATTFWHLIDVISGMNSFIGSFYEQYIGREYEKEKNQFHFKKHQSVLHIGCGAYPITAIILKKSIKGPIVAIDKNPFVVNIAKKIIQNKKLQETITIKQGNGATFDISTYDTIIISSCSIPKEQVIHNVFTHAKSSSTIILRELHKETKNILDIIKKYPNIHLHGEIDCYIFPGMHWRSYCLTIEK